MEKDLFFFFNARNLFLHSSWTGTEMDVFSTLLTLVTGGFGEDRCGAPFWVWDAGCSFNLCIHDLDGSQWVTVLWSCSWKESFYNGVWKPIFEWNCKTSQICLSNGRLLASVKQFLHLTISKKCSTGQKVWCQVNSSTLISTLSIIMRCDFGKFNFNTFQVLLVCHRSMSKSLEQCTWKWDRTPNDRGWAS